MKNGGRGRRRAEVKKKDLIKFDALLNYLGGIQYFFIIWQACQIRMDLLMLVTVTS